MGLEAHPMLSDDHPCIRASPAGLRAHAAGTRWAVLSDKKRPHAARF